MRLSDRGTSNLIPSCLTSGAHGLFYTSAKDLRLANPNSLDSFFPFSKLLKVNTHSINRLLLLFGLYLRIGLTLYDFFLLVNDGETWVFRIQLGNSF